jgi:hypothetical protein
MAVQGAGFKLADSLRAFTALEELALHAIPAGEAETLAEAVLELPRLRKLRNAGLWMIASWTPWSATHPA